jgi:hypothetical protein
MAHLLFAAHFPGPANMLKPVMPLARRSGHRLTTVACGAAAEIWRRAGEDVCDVDERPFEALAPDLLITGTGFDNFDRDLWRVAAGCNVGSLAVIDAWTNLNQRFVNDDGSEIQPDAICAIDRSMSDQIADEGWCGARIHITGQPHFQSVVERLKEKRKAYRPSSVPLLVFFSEPVNTDFVSDTDRGFDQFSVAGSLLTALAGFAPLSLVVQPHPRENRDDWQAWIGGRTLPQGIDIRIGEDTTETLLTTCDGAIGMTTMVLFEAALLGVPVLSLQPDRVSALNPRLDVIEGLELVTESAALPTAVGHFMRTLHTPRGIDPGLFHVIEDANRRLLSAIESEL